MGILFLEKNLRHTSCIPTVHCPAVTPLLSFCPSSVTSVSRSPFFSLSPSSPLSSFLLLLMCATLQGPAGAQGSPHPQPPPANSMMGPHSQVTLPLPLSLSLYFFCSRFLRLWSFGNAGSQCWCFMHPSRLPALCCFRHSRKWEKWEMTQSHIFERRVSHFLLGISWSVVVSVVVLHVASLPRRPKRSPHQDAQPGRAFTRTHTHTPWVQNT